MSKRVNIAGKRTLVSDNLRELADSLPEMQDKDGKPTNHFRVLKDINRLSGWPGVMFYVYQIHKKVKKERRKARIRLILKMFKFVK